MSTHQKNQFAHLLKKYLNGSANSTEVSELAKLAKEINKETYVEFFKEYWESPSETIPVLERFESDQILQKILHNTPEPQRVINLKSIIIRVAAAAAILLIIASGIISLQKKGRIDGKVETAEKTISPKDVLPGGNKAILTLPDGSIIVLDDTQEGLIHEQSGIKVIKTDEGKLVYKSYEVKPIEIAFNTISTPRGGQYKLMLPDGTMAILNANSRIRFPMIFATEKRDVEIEGEIYFEIAQNSNWPFIVKINDIEIEALGTSFNVMGYSDENAVKTTLIEGLVRVSTTTQDVILTPGQQSTINKQGTISVSDNINIADVIAWKEGWFKFSSTNIEEIMRQVSRWYDLDVVFEGIMPSRTYTGIVSRSSDLSKVLLMMEKAGISFRIQGDTIYVIY